MAADAMGRVGLSKSYRFYASGFSRTVSGHWIVAALAARVASRQSHRSEYDALSNSMSLYGLLGVLRARRIVLAHTGHVGRHHTAVYLEQEQGQVFHPLDLWEGRVRAGYPLAPRRFARL